MRKGRSNGARKGNFKGVPWGGHWPVYSHQNKPQPGFALETLVLQMKNCERVCQQYLTSKISKMV